MEEIKKFVKEHKKGCTIGGIAFLVLILVFFIFIVFPPLGNNNYGNRLDNESNYKVSNSKIDDIKDTISKEDGVNKITYHKEGRVLNFTIKLEDGIVLDTAKKYAEEITSKLSKKNLKYYDVQVFLDGKDESYPIIGYHSKGSEEFSWGNVGDN